jgi:regulator of sigma E protease
MPQYNAEKKMSFLGFAPETINEKYGLRASAWMAVKQTFTLTGTIFYSLFLLFTGKVGFEGLAGPLGIAQLTGQVAQGGFLYLFQFTAFISINLGIINLLPVPAMDGGRLLFLLIELVRGKPVDIEKEKLAHYIGFAFLMGLLILLTWGDLHRIFTKGWNIF